MLGKAIGTGIVTTAIKQEEASLPAIRAAVRSMRQLNREAADILLGHEVHAVTDVTGFGLLGHLREMCEASAVSARVRAAAPRILPDAWELIQAGCVPGGTRRNRESLARTVEWDPAVPDEVRTLLCDAQTSGGLLAAVPQWEAAELTAEWESAGYAASVIGEVEEGEPTTIIVEA